MLLSLLLGVFPVVQPVAPMLRSDGGTSFDVRVQGVSYVLPPASSMAAFGAQLTATEYVEASLAFPYTVNTELVRFVTDGGIYRSVRPFLELSGDAGSISAESTDLLRYLPGQGVNVRFTAVYSACANGSQQEVGIGTTQDGLFFGCCPSCAADGGASFGVLRRASGVDNWTPQASWNVNPRTDLNPQFGSPYAIDYQWLGFGQIRFHIEDPASGLFEPVHVVRYANTSASTSMGNPSLPLRLAVTQGAVLRVPSMSLIRQGANNALGVRQAASDTQNATTSELLLFAVRSNPTYVGAANMVRIKLDFLACSNSGSAGQDVTVRLREHSTITGGSWVDTNAMTSVSAVNVSGTTSSGNTVLVAQLEGASSLNQDISQYQIRLHPGDNLSVTIQSRTGAPAISCSLSWVEEF